MNVLLGLVSGLLIVGGGGHAAAQCEQGKVTAPGPAPSQFFGNGPESLAMDGDVLVVGVAAEDAADPLDPDCDSGAAYVYRFDGSMWTFEQCLEPSSGPPTCGQGFGRSVALRGDVVIVGAQGAVEEPANGTDPDETEGRGYVFRYDAGTSIWEFEQELAASDADPSDRFGTSVGISGDTAVIGAWRDEISFDGAGSAYVYTRDPSTGVWGSEQKLTAGDPNFKARFGFSVDVDGDVIAVGAQRDSSGSGAAYAFERQGGVWVEAAKLVSPDAGGAMGHSIAVDGDTIAVGTINAIDPDDSVKKGAVHVFTQSGGTWPLEGVLRASDGADGDEFGHSVAIGGDRIVVGAHQFDGPQMNTGAVHAYERDAGTWTEVSSFESVDASRMNDRFGSAVGLSGDRVVASAPGHFNGTAQSGAAYVFVNVFELGTWAPFGPGIVGQFGIPELSGEGDLNGGGAFEISITDAAANASGTMVVGLGVLVLPLKGGVLVPTVDLLVPLNSGPTGDLTIGSTWPTGAPGCVTFYLQYWLPDAFAVQGLAATNGLCVTSAGP